MLLNPHHWPISRRLLVAYALFLGPIAYLLYLLIATALTNVHIARNEQAGVQAIQAVADHLAGTWIGSTTGGRVADAIQRLDSRFEGAINADAVVQAAAALRAGGASHTDVSGALVDLITRVQDFSMLTLDPELDTYYLMDAITGKLNGLVHDLGILAMAGRETGGKNTDVEAAIAAERVRKWIEGIRASLGSAFDANLDGMARVRVGPVANRTLGAIERATSGTSGGRSEVLRLNELLTEIGSLREAGSIELRRLLDARVDRLHGEMIRNLAVSAIFFLVAVGFVLIAVQAGTVGPIKAMTAAMDRLAGGDLTVDIPATDRRDEVGHMATALRVFRDNAMLTERLRGEAERIREAKDKRQEAMDKYTSDFGLATAGVMGNLFDAASDMREQAADLSGLIARTRELARETATGAVESAGNLTTVATSAEQMSVSIDEIGRQVGRAAEVVRTTVEKASATDAKVAGLTDAAQAVGDVVKLISDIAGQTNLLALNATIEAARAGDAGKGFAVVAGEVKALAAQTARATEEIVAQIGRIRVATEEAVDAVRGMGSAILEVDKIAQVITTAVEQQAIVTRDIAASVQAVSRATTRATEAMENVSEMSGSADQASQAVQQGAGGVAVTADTLRTEVTHFLSAIARTGEEDRRRYERISGAGAFCVAQVDGSANQRAPIVEIARGGVSIRTPLAPKAGAEASITLLASDEAIPGRAVHHKDGVLGIAFAQDDASLRLIDHGIDSIVARADKQAA